MNQWLILGAVLSVAAAYFGGELSGTRNENTRWVAKSQADIIAASRRATEQARAIADQDAEILTGQEKTRIERRTVFKTLETERIKYVQTHPDIRDCKLDDDGLRQWNAANAGTLLRASVGQPESAAARIAPSTERELSRPVGQP